MRLDRAIVELQMQKAVTETATAFRRSNQLGTDPLCATVNVFIPENESSQIGHHPNNLKRLSPAGVSIGGWQSPNLLHPSGRAYRYPR